MNGFVAVELQRDWRGVTEIRGGPFGPVFFTIARDSIGVHGPAIPSSLLKAGVGGFGGLLGWSVDAEIGGRSIEFSQRKMKGLFQEEGPTIRITREGGEWLLLGPQTEFGRPHLTRSDGTLLSGYERTRWGGLWRRQRLTIASLIEADEVAALGLAIASEMFNWAARGG